MELFKFINPTEPNKLEQGVLINGYKTATWIERYREAGEFTITAEPESDLRQTLPVGTFISHIDTREVMLVETVNLKVTDGQTPVLTIQGHSYETYLHQRVVGANKVFPTSGPLTEFVMGPAPLATQAYYLINQHTKSGSVLDVDDVLPWVTTYVSVGTHPNVPGRTIQRGDLYDRLMELLALEDLGIKSIRPGAGNPGGASSPDAAFVIHEGEDKTDSVIFSNSIGEVKDAEYLWSNYKLKNAALVTGKWLETMVRLGPTGYDRRVMSVSATDVDQGFSAEPVGADRTTVLANLAARGTQALVAQAELTLSQVEVKPDLVMHKYRTDYNVGDIVTVIADYEQSVAMRVTEYVEIDDSESGSTGYPTLALY